MIGAVILTFITGYLTVIVLLPEITDRFLRISLSLASGIVIGSVFTFAAVCFQFPKQEIILTAAEIILTAVLLLLNAVSRQE